MIVNQNDSSVWTWDQLRDEYLGMVVDILPPSWQYPEIACARISLGGSVYESLYFRISRHQLTAPIVIQDETVGEIAVFYVEDRPEEDEGVCVLPATSGHDQALI